MRLENCAPALLPTKNIHTLEHRQRRNAQIAVFLCAAILIAVALGADVIRLSTRSGLGPMQLALAAVAITLFGHPER